MRQHLLAGGPAYRRRSARLLLVAVLALPLLLACGFNDILGKKPTATVPAALLATAVKTPASGAATATTTKAAVSGTTTATATQAAAAGTATTAAESAATQGPTSAGGQTTYTVEQGDTLSGIAQQFGVTTAELAGANSITDANKLSVGQTLIIPAPGTAPTAPLVVGTQQQTGGGAQAQYGQAIQLEQITGWLQALVPLVTTLATNPSGMCTSPEFDALLQQGQGLLGGLDGVTPPPEMAQSQAQLQGGMQGINDGLASAKTAMCQNNDSAGAMASLLQVSMSLTQLQGTLDSIGQFVQQGTSG